jgi:hypothetical protein
VSCYSSPFRTDQCQETGRRVSYSSSRWREQSITIYSYSSLSSSCWMLQRRQGGSCHWRSLLVCEPSLVTGAIIKTATRTKLWNEGSWRAAFHPSAAAIAPATTSLPFWFIIGQPERLLYMHTAYKHLLDSRILHYYWLYRPSFLFVYLKFCRAILFKKTKNVELES